MGTNARGFCLSVGAVGAVFAISLCVLGCPQASRQPVQVSFTAQPTRGVAPLAVHFEGNAKANPPYVLVDESGLGSKFRDEPQDPGDDMLTIKAWEWDFGDGAAGTGKTCEHVYAAPGRYTVSLTVVLTDSREFVETRVECVEVTGGGVNTAPVADAGPDQTVAEGALVTLDGTGSSDPDQDPLTYSWWIVTRPPASQAVLTGAATARPEFTADAAGEYIVRLVVNDGVENSMPDTVRIVAAALANHPPIADAGFDRIVVLGNEVHLDGSGSSDPDNDPLTYAWAIAVRPDGSTAVLSGDATVSPSFTPDVAGAYTIQLTVNDGALSSAPDTVVVTTGEAPNTAPAANAGPDQLVNVGGRVQLDGTGSSDPESDPLTYAWTLIAVPEGSLAALDDPASAAPAFTADLAGDYTAQLIVNDGVLSSAPDTVLIHASQNGPPVLSVTPLTYEVQAGATLEIPVSATDPDGDLVALSAGPRFDGGTFVASKGANPSGTFTFAPSDAEAGIYALAFTARDPMGLTDVENVQITVLRPNRPPELAVPGAVLVDEGQVATVPVTASDPDGDVLDVTAQPLPDNAVFLPGAGVIVFAPDYDQAGSYVVACEASDGESSSGSKTVAITVNDVSAGAEDHTLELTVEQPESPTLLGVSRIAGTVNEAPGLPDPAQPVSALITGLSPAQVRQGQTVEIAITGKTGDPYATHFVNGASAVDFGAGITVNSTEVLGPNALSVSISVAPTAALGVRPVQVTTGTEIAVCAVAFNVLPGIAAVTGTVIDADTGEAVTGARVSIEGTGISTTTGADGSYVLSGAPLGAHIVIINAPNHQLVRQSVNVAPGATTPAGETQTRPLVFDPSRPPGASALSVLNRGFANLTGDVLPEEAQAMIQDAMVLVGGADAGILDDYGNQVNPAHEGEGVLSLTARGRDVLVDRMLRAESYSLQRVLYAVSWGLEWTEGPPDLGEWMERLQAAVNKAWQDPTHPSNALIVLTFCPAASTIPPDPPVLVPETRLSAPQAFLLTSSLMAHAVEKEGNPALFGLDAAKSASKDGENAVPLADAGPDRTARSNTTVEFDGTASTDYDRDPLTFSWRLIYKPIDSAAELQNAGTARPTLTPDVEGYYKIRLVVNDSKESGAPDFVNLVVDDSDPIADAGVDRHVELDEPVQLDGSQSEDPGGGVLTYSWTFLEIPEGSTASFDDPASITPSFEPDVDGDYVVQLIVRTTSAASEPSQVVITAGNRQPVAYGGRDRVAKTGDTLAFDGSLSSDPDGDPLTYAWAVTDRPAGSTANLDSFTSPTPKLGPIDAAGQYVVRLIVFDGTLQSAADTVQITTEGTTYFSEYWRNFFNSKESNIKLGFAKAYEEEASFLMWESMLPGAGNLAASRVASDLVGIAPAFTGDALVASRAFSKVPEPPRLETARAITDPDGSQRVVVTFKRSISDPVEITGEPSAVERFVYRLYRFQGDTGRKSGATTDGVYQEYIGSKEFGKGATLEFEDTAPLPGTHLYALNVTRYIGREYVKDPKDSRDTNSWWPAAMASSVGAYHLGAERLTSDYSKSAAVYVGPGDFTATIDGVEFAPGDSKVFYYSDSTRGVFWMVDLEDGAARTSFANAGFKQSERDGAAVIQNGLAIDRSGNLYTDNAASDASFGGRLFRFTQPNGSREWCGVIGYYSQFLGFAHPVYSGPMVIRPQTLPVKETLLVAENLSQEIREVPVDESWNAERRVGQRYVVLPPGGWGRVIDMEFDSLDNLYILDGLRVLTAQKGATPSTFVALGSGTEK